MREYRYEKSLKNALKQIAKNRTWGQTYRALLPENAEAILYWMIEYKLFPPVKTPHTKEAIEILQRILETQSEGG